MDFTFEVAGAKTFHTVVDRMTGEVSNMTATWERIADDFYDTEKRIFAAEGAHDGFSRWNELGKDYVRWKQLHGYHTNILDMTGGLNDSLTDPNAPGAVKEIKPTGMAIGTNLKTKDGRWSIGLLWQLGTRFAAPRPPIEIGKETKRRWRGIIASQIQRTITQTIKGVKYEFSGGQWKKAA